MTLQVEESTGSCWYKVLSEQHTWEDVPKVIFFVVVVVVSFFNHITVQNFSLKKALNLFQPKHGVCNIYCSNLRKLSGFYGQIDSFFYFFSPQTLVKPEQMFFWAAST